MLQWANPLTTWLRRKILPWPNSVSADAERAWLQEEIRATATRQPFASPLTTPDGGFTAGETWEMRKAYREMAVREPAVKGALLTKVMAVAAMKPALQAANNASEDDRAAARWVDHAITHSDGGFPGLIFDTLFPSLTDGFSVGEPVWDKEDALADEYAGFWTLKKVKSKDTEYIRFRLDTYRNVEAVQAMNAGQGGFPFDPDDFLIFTHLSFFENPFGVSDLRAAFRAANLIESAIKLRAILLENFSGPYLVASAKDPTAQATLRGILAKARARGYIVIPDQSQVQVLNLATSAPDQFQATIKDLREEIVTAIQGAYLQLLEGGVSNGRGNTQVHQTVAQLFQWWMASAVCNLINKRLIPKLVRPNFGRRVGLPTLTLGGIDPAAVLTAIQRFSALQQLGLPLSKMQLYDEGAAEVPRDEADTIKPPAQQGGAQSQDPFAAMLGGGADQQGEGGANATAFADTFPAGHVFSLVDPEVLRKFAGRSR